MEVVPCSFILKPLRPKSDDEWLTGEIGVDQHPYFRVEYSGNGLRPLNINVQRSERSTFTLSFHTLSVNPHERDGVLLELQSLNRDPLVSAATNNLVTNACRAG